MAKSYIASDYAGCEWNGGAFYYGYEETTEEGEWCFKATIGPKKIIIPVSELGDVDKWNCAECLIAGIARLLDNHSIREFL